MAGLLTRIARGIGAGAESLGDSMIKQAREDRIDKLRMEAEGRRKAENDANRKADKESRTAGRESDQAFKTTYQESSQEFQAEQQTERLNAQKLSPRSRRAAPKASNIKQVKDVDGNNTEFSKFVDKNGDIMYKNDNTGAEAKSLDELRPKEEEIEPAQLSGADWADAQTSMSDWDSTSFAMFDDPKDRDEDEVAKIYTRMRDMAKAAGPEVLKKFQLQATADKQGLKWIAERWNRMNRTENPLMKGTITRN